MGQCRLSYTAYAVLRQPTARAITYPHCRVLQLHVMLTQYRREMSLHVVSLFIILIVKFANQLQRMSPVAITTGLRRIQCVAVHMTLTANIHISGDGCRLVLPRS